MAARRRRAPSSTCPPPSVTVGGIAYAGNTARDGWGATDILSNIEGAIGTAFGDTLIGRTGSGAPAAGRRRGDDSLAGGNLGKSIPGGPDTILGGAGNDIDPGQRLSRNRSSAAMASTR